MPRDFQRKLMTSTQSRFARPTAAGILGAIITLGALACATPQTIPSHTETLAEPKVGDASSATREKQLQSLVQQLSQKLEEMEGKLTALNDKIDATRAGVETLALSKPSHTGGTAGVPTTVAVLPHPVDVSRSGGIPTSGGIASTEPGSAYINDSAIQEYRKAKILLETQKYRDAILQFGSFLDQHPDHVLAGSAQYHIGEAYYQMGETKLAEQELQRVLTSYDRSVFVPDTHRLLAVIHSQLKDPAQAALHQQKLVTLYPQSPAAKEGMNPALQREVPQIESKTAHSEPKTAELNVKPESALGLQSTTPGLDAPPEPQSVPTAPSGIESDIRKPTDSPQEAGTVAPSSAGDH